MNTQPFLDRSRASIAALLAFLLVLAGALTAAPAFAAGPAVSAPLAPRAGGMITLTGSGFAGVSPGIYLGVGPAGLAGFYAGSAQMTDVVWIAPGNTDGSSGQGRTAPMTAEGAFTVQVAVPAHTAGAQYAVYTSKAHGQGFADPSQNTTTVLAWEPAPAATTKTTLTVDPAGSAEAGSTITLAATVEPAASGTVTFSDGGTVLGSVDVGATLATSIATAGTAQLKAEFTPADPAAFTGSTSAVVPYEITAPPAEPRSVLTVSKTADLNPAGETITVTGTGYEIIPGGIYAQVGWIVEGSWTPISASDTRSSHRSNAYAALIGSGYPGQPAFTVADDGTGSFTWTVTLDQAKLDAKRIEGGTLAVFTLGSHANWVQPANERFVPISFAEPEPVPSLDVTVTDASASGGATIEVAGTGLGDVTSAYAAIIDKDAESQLTPAGGYVVFALPFPQVTDGATSFGVVAPTAKLDRTKQYEVLVWRLHSNPSTETIYARADVPFTAADWEKLFPGTLPPVDPKPPVTPSEPAVTPPAQGAGSLSWAISSDFTEYITNGPAHGSIAVTGGATRADGRFQFGQAAGSAYDPATATGTVSYVGAVRFTGHGGVLDVTIANPQVQITSPSAATLYVTSAGSQVAFASLDLAAAVRSTVNGAVTYSKAPATLTAAGRDRIFRGYGTQLDPVTFTIGAPAPAPAGATGTVAAARASATRGATLPATPPASTGIDVDDATLAALQKGELVTVSASGFAPNEAGIQVVVYSTPTLLAEVTADAAGTATWSGTLPATLADGEHTLTFQGSVDRGIRFTLSRAAAASGCLVEAASLAWGFKESFRTYIEGIAAGGWELSGVAYEYPQFVWNTGTGAVDAATRTGLVTYGGSIRFTGHQGALDTTLSNARVELAGDVGYLVLDVSGTTQAGEPVTAAGVRFAEFALPDLEIADDALVLDAVPATLTAAGAEAFGTYAAGDELDPVSAVLPLAAECEPAVAVEDDAPVAEAAEAEAVAVEPVSAPVWPWAVGGIALALGIGAVVWIVVSRRRATAGAQGDPTAG